MCQDRWSDKIRQMDKCFGFFFLGRGAGNCVIAWVCPPQRTRGYGTYLEMFQGDKYYKITRLYNTTSVQLKYR